MNSTIHQAGNMTRRGVQICDRCGVILTDYRNAMVPEGSGPLSGWREGAFVEVFPGNPTQLAVTLEAPTCEELRVGLLRSDVSAIEGVLRQYVDCPEVWGDTINRLREALNMDPL